MNRKTPPSLIVCFRFSPCPNGSIYASIVNLFKGVMSQTGMTMSQTGIEPNCRLWHRKFSQIKPATFEQRRVEKTGTEAGLI